MTKSATAEEDYDVVVSEPTNPAISGVANLFTLDHYTNAKAARHWALENFGGDESSIAKHFAAVSTNASEVA